MQGRVCPNIEDRTGARVVRGYAQRGRSAVPGRQREIGNVGRVERNRGCVGGVGDQVAG